MKPASAQDLHSHKSVMPTAALGSGPAAVSQDVGDIAVVVDNGLMVTARNLFDLTGVTVRFAPAGDHLFTVSSSPGTLDTDFGPELTFGYPGATLFPGDDDTQELAFPAGFPFFGTTYTSVWVNTDGNITFGEPDFASSERDKVRHVLGPPRVSAFLHDWNAFNAFNPEGSGTIHAVVKTNPDRLVATWNGVADFEGGVSSTFQVTLYSSGAAEVTIANIDTPTIYGVVGIAEGTGSGLITNVDLSALGSPQTLPAGAILEAFAALASASEQETAREFYKTHADKFDYLVILTDFSTGQPFYDYRPVSNHTHGIGTRINPSNGAYQLDTVYDFTAEHGSAGELEEIVFMNNIFAFWPEPDRIVNPPIEPYSSSSNVIMIPELFGLPVTLDGQVMSLNRLNGTLPPDDGELSQHYLRDGIFGNWIMSLMGVMSQEVEHRYGANLRFVHPTKGTGFDSYDLLGRDTHHWSYFLNTAVPSSQFPDAPRASPMEGNNIVDLGTPASFNGTPTNLAPGQRVFQTPATELLDGYSNLDQYLMGLRRADEVGPFFYVDEPESIYTGQSLDPFNPSNVLDTSVTMRGWQPQGGIVFKGKRVDLTVQNIKDFEKIREHGDNPQGRRFWGPKGNLTVHYSSSTGHVDPNGDASVVLSVAERELGDEADMIDLSGKPVDVKTMAFILLVQSGPPHAHPNAISGVDTFRQAWQAYGNGPATGGRGKFDTRLDPPIY